MRRIPPCAVVLAWLFVMLFTSACSVLDFAAPPPLETAFNPLPPPPAPPVPSQAKPPSPEDARAEIYRWFMTHGYKSFQAEALMEHAQTESGYRACANGGPYRYLFQWSGTRLQQLESFAGYAGCPQLHTQLAFADNELRNNPKFSCFWAATTEDAAYTALRRGFGRGAC
jgi:tail lysozyme